jgi:periplasmic protein TonB
VYKFLAIFVLFAATGALAFQPASGKRPPRVVCGNSQQKILKIVKPTYPAEALKKNIFGKILVELVTDTEGRPKRYRVSKGDPALAQAVLQVLPQWRWKPYLLNGKPVEIETTVTVNFEPGRP